jgi:glycosyltransferase involved in cell wall biosynthesis
MLLLGNAKLLHTVHNLAEREIEPPARVVHRYAFSHGVIPIAVGEEVAVSMKRLYGIPQCKVIANCIPTSTYANPGVSRRQWRAQQGFVEDDVLFVCVARFARQKNHALLIKAFAQVCARHPNTRLLLVGDGVLRNELETQVNGLGLDGRVRFLGLRADIPEVLAACDVFVLSSEFEGNPLSVLEAMAASLPTISTAVGGVPSLLENGTSGILVHSGDAEGFSKAMESLLLNRGLRQSMGVAAARSARERFDVANMVRAYEEVYESLQSQLRLDDQSVAVGREMTTG